MNSETFMLVKWKQRSAWPSKFEALRRNVGDTNIVSKQVADNLARVGLVDIVGLADVVVSKMCDVEREGEEHGSVPSDDPLSPFEG